MRRADLIQWLKPGLSAVSMVSVKIKVVWELFKVSCFGWYEDNAPSMGAALTFYAILSLAPVLIIATAIAGMVFSQKVVEAEVLRHIQALVGEAGIRIIQATILSAHRPALGAVAGTISIVAMFVGASGAFVELHDSLNRIWRVKPKSGSFLWRAIKQRFLSFSLVLSTGILMLLSLVSSATLAVVERFMGQLLPWPVFFLEAVNFVLSCGAIMLLLAAIFKLLPDTAIAWKDVWIGATVASLLLTTGKMLIGFFLGGSAVTSAYGAVSTPLVVLVWIYYSAQIFLFGAEITCVYANKHGSRVAIPPPEVGEQF